MIRMVTEEDAELCCRWYNWYIEHSTATWETEPLTSGQFAERIRNVRRKYPWIILEEEGVPAGYAYLSHFNERAAYDWTADVSIYVAPEMRKKGYGRKLMQALIDIAVKDGYKQLVSIITEGNAASEKLHQNYGFNKIAVFADFGYKAGQWMGVSYWVKTIASEFEHEPAKPQNPDITEE